MKPLQPGDLIAIVAPSKAIEASHIEYATSLFESRGYRVQVGAHCLGNHHYFSGTDVERAADLQQALDNPEVKAIICARGGYGCVFYSRTKVVGRFLGCYSSASTYWNLGVT